MVATVKFLVTWGIFALIPVMFDEIDPFITGVVLAAIAPPLPGMAWPDTQINGRAVAGHKLGGYRLAIIDLRRRITADIKPPIEAGLTDPDRGGFGGAGQQGGDGE